MPRDWLLIRPRGLSRAGGTWLTRTDASTGGLRRSVAGRLPEPPELSLFRRDLAVEIGCEAGEHVVAVRARELRSRPPQPQRRRVKRFDPRDGLSQRTPLIGDTAQDCNKAQRSRPAGGRVLGEVMG